MGTVIASYALRFTHPWWLLATLVAVPLVWLTWRGLAAIGAKRRVVAIGLRVLVVLLLAILLADPAVTQTHDQVTLIAVFDRSQSIPPKLQEAGLAYLAETLGRRRAGDRLAVIDVAELSVIEKLASGDTQIDHRVTSLSGEQTNLAGGVQLGLAIAPPNTAVRFLIVSDGNETSGDLRDAARVVAANRIPIDVLPLRYRHDQEVVFNRLVSPPNARSGQTVSLRFVLTSTGPAKGKIHLSLNGQPVDLDPSSDAVAAEAQLKAGTNVKTISLPLGTRGLHEFEATFVPDDPSQDVLIQNNKASSMTYVSGPGHVLILDEDGKSGAAIGRVLSGAGIETRTIRAEEFPQQLPELLDADAVILANASCSNFSMAQQELMVNYVKELGGGLVMVGGPLSFGAGGWIGSPLAEVLPVDLDPPQKKQMPKGALVLIMHSCEMPQGNYWGKEVATAAVSILSRLDLAGVVSYGWQNNRLWDFPLAAVGDKTAVISAIKQMQMGDMPDFAAPMQAAYDALKACDAVQKHVIMISDGDPQPPSAALLAQYKAAGITCTGVAVFPHSNADVQSLVRIAQSTGGRFYHVKDPNLLPQIFVKEAQTVKRALINEELFTPKVVAGASELLRGVVGVPPLNGYVLTGPRGGAAQLLMTGPEDDPILANWQVGVGRCVAVTTSADSRWAPSWMGWGGFNRFWEQTIRWVGKSRQPTDCVVFADVQGRQVTLTVEGLDRDGNFVQFSGITGRVVGPDMKAKDLTLGQTGPGQYRSSFTAGRSGSYLVNLRYQRADAKPKEGETIAPSMVQSVVNVPYAPEFRDLADNAPLLEEVARETGGRVMPADTAGVDLFTRAGLTLPETPLPITKPLLIAWIVVFLLDVAVRRLALNFRAGWQRATGWVTRLMRPSAAKEEAHLAQLQTRSRKVREQLSAKTADPNASRRFEASGNAPAEMPDDAEKREAARMAAAAAARAARDEKKPQAPPAQAGAAHLDQLLKARRARKEADQDKDPGGA